MLKGRKEEFEEYRNLIFYICITEMDILFIKIIQIYKF